MRAHDEGLRRRVEADESVGVPLADPDDVGVVDEHRIWLGPAARKHPLFPSGPVVPRELPCVPFAHPDAILRVTPHPPRALTRGWRNKDDRAPGLLHDAADVAARERRVIDLAIRAARDP